MSSDGWKILIVDASQEDRAEEELRSTLRTLEEERTRLRIILENLPVGVRLTDADGRTSRLNSTLNDSEAKFRTERHLREQAEAALRAKDEFVAVVSHELRAPLNAIDGWVQILRSRATGDDLTQRAVETIERNVKAQTQLIGDLLDMSRILSGKMQLEIHRVDPEAVIASAIDSVRHAAEAKGVTIEVRRDPGVPELDADPARLQQVIWNLVSNAVKFTPAGGRIEILLERLDDTLRIRVNDTGKGIAADFLPFVFDRFRQEDASARRQGGLGLGLSIVRHLVELHGGTVDVESPGEGLGASFTVDLPIPPSSRELPYPAVTGTAETDQAARRPGRHAGARRR